MSKLDLFPFLGSSKTGKLIRAFDWKKTSLGELSQWPACLRAATSLILRSDVPMTIQWGIQGWLLYNDAYCNIAGARHPGLLGQTVHDSWSEIADFRALVVKQVLDGNTVNYRDKHMVLLRNGEFEDIWLDINYSPLVNETGTPVGVLTILNNATERFQAEQRLRFAQEAGRVGTFEWYPDSGRLEGSDQYRRVWGVSADVVLTDTLLISLVHPDDQHALRPQPSGPPNPIAYLEFRRVDPVTGEIRWIARRGEAILLDGGVRRYVGIVMDITDRKKSEQALAQSEARRRQWIEQMDIKQIRHRNVRTLVRGLERDASRGRKRTGGLVMLAEMLGKSAAQVSRFAAEKPSTHIGDRIAREIEQAFGKERGWMDHVQWSAKMDCTESAETLAPA
ncbi:PAS domain S-box protein [Rhodanobacter sp. MP7CTX1]|uniref:PAS domain-containing protein n=1 Tax=Rhodanobacter sp. MP7CTX1 TaxID=2723084 RepID=UPI001610BFFA|nr:PAS domain S-box protein [Rhodanobacter sp. MP7CTX1]MBB6187588.1 PAS domain S-box-containing protein [Rhodanobacter sp. MP7CTX1]